MPSAMIGQILEGVSMMHYWGQHYQNIHNEDLHRKIRQKQVRFGGNKKLKIYGLLSCSSGKRMKRENRILFTSEPEALQNNYRPCGHCMKEQYKKWKNGII